MRSAYCRTVAIFHFNMSFLLRWAQRRQTFATSVSTVGDQLPLLKRIRIADDRFDGVPGGGIGTSSFGKGELILARHAARANRHANVMLDQIAASAVSKIGDASPQGTINSRCTLCFVAMLAYWI